MQMLGIKLYNYIYTNYTNYIMSITSETQLMALGNVRMIAGQYQLDTNTTKVCSLSYNPLILGNPVLEFVITLLKPFAFSTPIHLPVSATIGSQYRVCVESYQFGINAGHASPTFVLLNLDDSTQSSINNNYLKFLGTIKITKRTVSKNITQLYIELSQTDAEKQALNALTSSTESLMYITTSLKYPISF